MKKTIISLSLVAGLVLCGGLHSLNKAVEAKSDTKNNINLLSKSYVMDNKITASVDPGTFPPEGKA